MKLFHLILYNDKRIIDYEKTDILPYNSVYITIVILLLQHNKVR